MNQRMLFNIAVAECVYGWTFENVKLPEFQYNYGRYVDHEGHHHALPVYTESIPEAMTLLQDMRRIYLLRGRIVAPVRDNGAWAVTLESFDLGTVYETYDSELTLAIVKCCLKALNVFVDVP